MFYFLAAYLGFMGGILVGVWGVYTVLEVKSVR